MRIFIKIINLCGIILQSENETESSKEQIEASEIKEIENFETLKQNENQELLFFESVLNIESLIFLMGTNSINDTNLSKILEVIIFPFQVSLKNIIPTKKEDSLEIKRFTETERKKFENLITNLSNFSKSVEILNEPQLSKSIEFRNHFFLSDKSQISKFLYLENLKKIKHISQNSSNDELLNLLEIEDLAVKRLKFRKMFEEFGKAIMHTENLHKIIKSEKDNFLNLFLFKKEINLTEYKKIRMIVNLGGSFILPSLLFHLNENLLTNDREEFMHKLIMKILKPIEALKLEITHRSSNEKKIIIINFLKENMKNPNQYHEAFESRSNLLQIYFKGNLDKMHKIDFYQDFMLKKYINQLKKYDTEFFDKFLILNKEVAHTYEEYINTGQLGFKDKLKEYFDEL